MTKAKGTKTFEYISGKKYDGMMGRCYREADKSYPRYGGRGIRVEKAWIANIENFRRWLREELFRRGISVEDFSSDGMRYQLDRVNGDDHYTPANCRIVSPQLNGRNKYAKRTLIAADGSSITI